MQFSVIYSVDDPPDENMLDFAPLQVEELWHETEDDGQCEYGYLEDRWESGHHRKWAAVLTREQLDEFVAHPLSPRRARPLRLLVASQSASGFAHFAGLTALASVRRPDPVQSCGPPATSPEKGTARLWDHLGDDGVAECRITNHPDPPATNRPP